MPIYTFQCFECETEEKVQQSIYEPIRSDIMCPKCGYHMNRVYEAPGVQFKGGGFYSTSGRG